MSARLRLLASSLLSLAVVVGACSDDEADPGGPGGSGRKDGGTSGGEGGGAPPPERAQFGLEARPKNLACKAPPRPPLAAPVAFQRVYGGLTLEAPMGMAQLPGDPSRWFVARRGGTIVVFDAVSPGTPKVAATLASVGTNGEGGLLGFAFHPKCTKTSCRLFVSWTPARAGGQLRSEIGYFTSTNGTDFAGYKPVLGPFDQPYANHNGGGIAFDKEGLLYVSFGDGGSAYDPQANGQKKTTFLSKVLRIDVDDVPAGKTYGIPAGNPFRDGGGEPATFAYGFRNPFRLSVDRETGDVWVADVGQARWEEIDRVELGGNYGWPCREGAHDYPYPHPAQEPPGGPALDAAKCPGKSGLRDPVAEHEHTTLSTHSITGGVVYRGKAIPAMIGAYVYGDYKTQELFALTFDPATGKAVQTQLNDTAPPSAPWVAFSEDLAGEIYAVALNGQIWKMVPKPGAPASTFPDRLSKTGCVDPGDPTRPAEGLIPFGVNAPLWSDGAEKERFLALPEGSVIGVEADGDFTLPKGTVLLKTFRVGGKPVETRLFIHHDDDVWAGYSYEWLDDGSDAVLLPSSKRKAAGGQEWFFPSRSDCVRCHTEAAGRSLGLELGQLNGDLVYPSTNRISNQLTTLDHIGLFAKPLGAAADLAAFPAPTGDGAIEGRARAYLHSNCASCHRPKGGGGGELDLRFATALGDTGACNVLAAGGEFGIAGARLLVPGDPAKSLLSRRPRSVGAHRMPPLATSIVDGTGMDVVDGWIDGLASCP